MRMFIWGPAIIIPTVAVVFSIGLFIGIAVFLEVFHDYALALGTVLFIAISAAAWFLAQRTEREHAANNPDQSAGHH